MAQGVSFNTISSFVTNHQKGIKVAAIVTLATTIATVVALILCHQLCPCSSLVRSQIFISAIGVGVVGIVTAIALLTLVSLTIRKKQAPQQQEVTEDQLDRLVQLKTAVSGMIAKQYRVEECSKLLIQWILSEKLNNEHMSVAITYTLKEYVTSLNTESKQEPYCLVAMLMWVCMDEKVKTVISQAEQGHKGPMAKLQAIAIAIEKGLKVENNGFTWSTKGSIVSQLRSKIDDIQLYEYSYDLSIAAPYGGPNIILSLENKYTHSVN